MLDRRRWTTRDELCSAIVTWIERTYYRRRRRQAARGRLTAIEYEIIMTPPATLAAFTGSCSSPPSLRSPRVGERSQIGHLLAARPTSANSAYHR